MTSKEDVHILCTKLIDSSYIEQYSALNIVIDSIPFIHTETTVNNIIKQDILDLAKQNITVVFTSSNAVNAVAEIINDISIEHWRIYCLSGNTLRSANKLLKSANVIDTATNVGALAQKVIQQKESGPVHFFCNDIRLQTLPATLHKASIDTIEHIVYKTNLTPVNIDKEYSGIIFYSPSAVRSFFSENVITDKTVLFAIGQTTAGLLKDFMNTVVISEHPDTDSMLKAVHDHYKNNRYEQ